MRRQRNRRSWTVSNKGPSEMPWHEKVLIAFVIVVGVVAGCNWLLHALARGMD